MIFEAIFSVRRLRALVRSGDSQRFDIDLVAHGEAIIARIAADAAAKIVPLTAFVTTKVKRKNCVAYAAYPENIVLRAVANYISRRFRVATSNRDRTVRGVIESMFDQTPFHVIRRDLSSFYETVPLEPVRSRLLYDTAIPRAIRHYLKEYFDHHCAGSSCGLPRGVGLTTVLVELAMQPFDEAVRAIPGVYRYFRYSDDILIFCFQKPEDVEVELKRVLKKLPGMTYNHSKSDTQHFDGEKHPGPSPIPSTTAFDYLGYRFAAEQRCGRKAHRKVEVSIARKKVRTTKTRIYRSLLSLQKGGNPQDFVDRIRILTGNYRILRRGITKIAASKHIFAGIYFNYWRCGTYNKGILSSHPPAELRELDNFLHGLLKGKSSPFSATLLARLSAPQRAKLAGISFERGFVNRRMVRIPAERFAKLKAVWRNA